MNFDEPLTFTPIYQERIWGGRLIADALKRTLPGDGPIGESWEMVDRPEAQSIVNQGAHTGASLHELWTNHRTEVFGANSPDLPRFPLLLKILDAKETLSVQVHPPSHLAAELKGEPKTEMWYLLGAEPDAAVYAGLTNGTTREQFETAITEGGVENLLHRLPVESGDAIFIPSGRCHAIGAGCLIVEIQQNSDTTYRVFDWNRVGLDGKARELHVSESLASIDFADHEPDLSKRDAAGLVIECEYFRVAEMSLSQPFKDEAQVGAIYTVIEGVVKMGQREFVKGDFVLLPASSKDRVITPVTPRAKVVRTTIAA